MSVRNIDKGYIGTSNSSTVSFYTTTLSFIGGIVTTANATFNKIGRIIVLTLDPVVGDPVSSVMPQATNTYRV